MYASQYDQQAEFKSLKTHISTPKSDKSCCNKENNNNLNKNFRKLSLSSGSQSKIKEVSSKMAISGQKSIGDTEMSFKKISSAL